MRMFAVALGSVVIALSGQFVVAGPADADTPGCVSKAELERVGDTNYSKRRIHRIFDTRGRLDDRDRDSIERVYKGCPNRSRVGVNYTWRNHAWRWWGHWSYGF